MKKRHKQENKEEKFIKAEKVRDFALMYQNTKMLNRAFTVRLPKLSTICVTPAKYDLPVFQIH